MLLSSKLTGVQRAGFCNIERVGQRDCSTDFPFDCTTTLIDFDVASDARLTARLQLSC